MKTSNTIQRLLLFFAGIPIILLPIIFLPHGSYLVTNLMIIAVSLLSTWEISELLYSNGVGHSRWLAPIAGGILPLAAYLEILGLVTGGFVWAILTGVVLIILIKKIHPKKEGGFERVFQRSGTDIFLFLYPGLFLSYVVRLSAVEPGSKVLIFFILLIFLNDSAAWLTGVLWGRSSRAVVAVSPNKSLVGFIGGLTVSILLGMAAVWGIPAIFGERYWLGALLGLIAGMTTILGDLFESALKRSLNTKDSGNLVPGRGGFLDSLDSFLFTAPLLYYFLISL